MKISIIIPVHNPGQAFAACLSSLNQLEPPPEEVIVVADGDQASARQAEAAGLRVITTPAPGGPARARNLGAQQAGGDILFFIDADVTAPPDAVARVQNQFIQNPDLAALIGSYDDQPGDPGFLSQYRNLFHHFIHQQSDETASTFWGACGVIRRDIFLMEGGFDERYVRPSIEDIELGYRLVQKGHAIKLDKDLQVKHLKRWTPWNMVKTDFLCRALPWTMLMLRNRYFVSDLNLRIQHRISVICVFSLLMILSLAVLQPLVLLLGAVPILVLITLNLSTYRFYHRKRGLWFAIRVVPWHWLYYLYGGLAFAIGVVRHVLFDRKRSLRSTEPVHENI